MKTLYPWLSEQWKHLLRSAESNRLGHALLFSGSDGLGVEELALAFSEHALCEASIQRPCGGCRSCNLLAAGSHPDFKLLRPSEEGKAIVVDQVREIVQFYALKSHYARAKVVLIHPANSMNRAASNAILKILEEPPQGALLLLVAHRYSDISMTIRSRCVRVPCDQVDRQVALDWLAEKLPDQPQSGLNALVRLSGGAPLGALALAANNGFEIDAQLCQSFERIVHGHSHALVEAKKFKGLALAELQRHLGSMITQIIFAKFELHSFYEQTMAPLDSRLQGLSDHLNLKHLYAFLDLMVESKSLAARQSGLRDGDLAETLWLGLARAAQNPLE
ncbi:MAG: DNA polymerase III subunit delta' [Proteobacteria bacterium]|nr:DNA polymerase III subunit delta' [Pseudomonadota bacterium]